jgi:biopolymer transport protein ExbB/TolQ
MIKSNPLSVILVFVLFLSALASCWSAAWWFLGARELQALEYEFQSLNQTSTAMQSIANEALEYSRRNPSIDPLLVQFELKPRPAAPPVQTPLRSTR